MKYKFIVNEIKWIFPFFAFIFGYLCLQFFIADNQTTVPALVGKNILEATKICSQAQINLRIIAEKETADTPAGTIIAQNPSPDKLIKKNQSIFITITQAPQPIIAPNFLEKNQEEIEQICKEKGLKSILHLVPSSYPSGKCFAQQPTANTPLTRKKISCYLAANQESYYIFPDFTDLPLQDVIHFLQHHAIAYDVYYKNQKIAAPFQAHLQVAHQKPLAGSTIQSMKNLYVQLQLK
ncbi:MAG: PASTA domain-containing protein [Candidatus Chromulinivorax sp.]